MDLIREVDNMVMMVVILDGNETSCGRDDETAQLCLLCCEEGDRKSFHCLGMKISPFLFVAGCQLLSKTDDG